MLVSCRFKALRTAAAAELSHSASEGVGLVVDVTPAFAVYLAGNRGPTLTDPSARERPDYGISASLDGAVLELVLTFRAGSAYCCGEWPCHFLLFPTRRWDRLR